MEEFKKRRHNELLKELAYVLESSIVELEKTLNMLEELRTLSDTNVALVTSTRIPILTYKLFVEKTLSKFVKDEFDIVELAKNFNNTNNKTNT